jgi:hypothetical protein
MGQIRIWIQGLFGLGYGLFNLGLLGQFYYVG